MDSEMMNPFPRMTIGESACRERLGRAQRECRKLLEEGERLRGLCEAQRHLIRCLDGERAATRMYAAEAAKRERDREWCLDLGEAKAYCQARTYRARKALQKRQETSDA